MRGQQQLDYRFPTTTMMMTAAIAAPVILAVTPRAGCAGWLDHRKREGEKANRLGIRGVVLVIGLHEGLYQPRYRQTNDTPPSP
uniref:Uncharacterized protein n=1 Tax=Candidatus Kentrum sp. TC TaxID=2126339 RepID=A0A450YUJ6_9GAMM|nr:MAG: hypothetical protein BECKTC1821E_GA0114239_104416 [Candidatus Kentron sp. TC]